MTRTGIAYHLVVQVGYLGRTLHECLIIVIISRLLLAHISLSSRDTEKCLMGPSSQCGVPLIIVIDVATSPVFLKLVRREGRLTKSLMPQRRNCTLPLVLCSGLLIGRRGLPSKRPVAEYFL